MRSLMLLALSLLFIGGTLQAQVVSESTSAARSPQILILGGASTFQGSNEFFDMVSQQLALSRGDFRSPSLGIELDLPLLPRVSLVLGSDVANREVSSQAVRALGAPQQQDTQLRAATGYAGLKFHLQEEAAEGSRRAWDSYLIVAGGALQHRLVQDGDFVDRRDAREEFGHRFESSGWGWVGEGGLGLARTLSDRTSLHTSVRYRWAEATMRDDFAGFAPLKLQGVRFVVGGGVRLGGSSSR